MARFRAGVVVMPRPVVNDPQGVTVAQGLRTLGFELEGVRVGKYVEVVLDATDAPEASARVDAMCRRLLANHVIEDYRFDLEPVSEAETT